MKINLSRLPKKLIFFWLTQIGIVLVLWDFLPSRLSGDLLIALVVINGVLLYLQQFELPVFSNIALLLALAHFWLGNDFVSPLLVSLVIFVGITLTGLIAHSFNNQIGRDEILVWFLVGLFTTQIATLTQFWPITYFQKSMLGTIVFYLIWQSWRVIDPSANENSRPIWTHFIFVGATVMVVIANIVWTTWPGLKTF